MSSSIDGRRTSSGHGSAQRPVNTKMTWPTTLRVDAPTFKPASPPKSNPWTNFGTKPLSQPLTQKQLISDPPLPSQARNEEEDQLDSEAARSDASGRSRRSSSTGSKHKLSSPVSRSSWADESTKPGPKGVLVDGYNHKENIYRTMSSTNPWFSSNNPFARKTKANSEPPELYSSDPPLPPISETDSTFKKVDSLTSSNTSRSTVLGSSFKNEISVADQDRGIEQTEQAEPLISSEAPSRPSKPEKPSQASRPPSRESTHSLTSADTTRRTARSASTSSEDSRRAMAPALASQQVNER